VVIFKFVGAIAPLLMVILVDRKLDLLVDELAHYGIAWLEFKKPNGLGQMFGLLLKDTHYYILGRPTPNVDACVFSGGEGVGIIMNNRATVAWRAAGEEWKAVSSRLVMARLKWTQKSWQRSIRSHS